MVANALSSFAVVATLFAFIYKTMPSVHIRWGDVWVGAVVTALMFTLGKSLIGLYIGHSGVVSGFGAASSLVIVMLWVYYSAQIFLIGAEFTWIYANTFGSQRSVAASENQSLQHSLHTVPACPKIAAFWCCRTSELRVPQKLFSC